MRELVLISFIKTGSFFYKYNFIDNIRYKAYNVGKWYSLSIDILINIIYVKKEAKYVFRS